MRRADTVKGGFRPLDAEHAVFDALAGSRAGPRRAGQQPQALVEGEPALGEPVVRAGRDRQATVGGNCRPARTA